MLQTWWQTDIDKAAAARLLYETKWRGAEVDHILTELEEILFCWGICSLMWAESKHPDQTAMLLWTV